MNEVGEFSHHRDEVAAHLRAVSDAVILPRFGALAEGEIDTKSSATDFVTIADKEAEIALIDRLSPLFEGALFIGEETCAQTPALKLQADAPLVLTIDPIDGTRNFVNQKQSFCTMLALCVAGVPVASWIYLPLSDSCYFAAKGQGVFISAQRGTAFTALPKRKRSAGVFAADATGSIGLLGLAPAQQDRMRAKARDLVGRQFIGSAGVEILTLANGEMDYMFHGRTTPWDHAPVALFGQESDCLTGHLPDADSFNITAGTPILVADNQQLWDDIARFVELKKSA